MLSVEGAAVQTAAAAIAAITSRLESGDNDGPISLTLVRSPVRGVFQRLTFFFLERTAIYASSSDASPRTKGRGWLVSMHQLHAMGVPISF